MKSKTRSCNVGSHQTFYVVATILIVLTVAFLVKVWSVSKETYLLSTNCSMQIGNVGDVKKLTTFVDKAAALVSSKGESAYPVFRKQGSSWWQGDRYIFVYDMTGKTLVLPPQPTVEGTSRYSVQDSGGIYFVREMIKQLANNDFGWLEYSYPKPKESSPSPKLSYFKKVKIGNKTVIVGSGIYLK